MVPMQRSWRGFEPGEPLQSPPRATAGLIGATVLAVLPSLGSPARAALLVGDSKSSVFANCTGCGSGSTATSLALSTFTLDITTPFTFNVPATRPRSLWHNWK
jgi:hypothetical protein